MLNILDVEAEIRSKMENMGASKWRCLECNFVSKSTNVFYHIESKHVEGAGYFCNICMKFCKTKNALNIHMSNYHKQLKWYILTYSWTIYRVYTLEPYIVFRYRNGNQIENGKFGRKQVEVYWVQLCVEINECVLSHRRKACSRDWSLL